MKTNRRKFLGFLGGAAVAGPSAAKAAAGNVLEKAGVQSTSGLASGTLGMENSLEYSDNPERILSVIKNFGFPSWRREEIRQHTKHVGFLDADIGSLTSVSPSAQLRMQRERNFNQALAEAQDATFLRRRKARDAWSKKYKVESFW